MAYDLAVVGGGIVGLTVARAFLLKYPRSSVLVLDKESDSISHGTGRNSGVIHSGIYYDENTLRARLCKSGSQRMIEYVESKNLWIDRCGKLLIPSSEASLGSLDTLRNRGFKNGVETERVDGKLAKELEPRVNTQFDIGLFVPTTSVVDPKAVAQAVIEDIEEMGGFVRYNSLVTTIDSDQGKIIVNNEHLHAAIVVNAAGLFADRIAKNAGLKMQYSFQPFKGKYWRHKNPCFKMSRLVYPIPDLKLPFLGVHTAHNREGHVYFGPSSTPVIGRENYSGIQGIDLPDGFRLTLALLKKLINNTNGLRSLAVREAKLLQLKGVCREVSQLVHGVKPDQLEPSPFKVGIRSQIFDTKSEHLVNDFVVTEQSKAIHILNAISPAFTASFAFADYILQEHIK